MSMFICFFATPRFMPVQGFFRAYNKARKVMRIVVKRCIKMLDVDVRDDIVLHQQPLFPLLEGRRMSMCFNQEASGVVMPQVGVCAILPAACNTPPR
jgi:hypothetical protein